MDPAYSTPTAAVPAARLEEAPPLARQVKGGPEGVFVPECHAVGELVVRVEEQQPLQHLRVPRPAWGVRVEGGLGAGGWYKGGWVGELRRRSLGEGSPWQVVGSALMPTTARHGARLLPVT